MIDIRCLLGFHRWERKPVSVTNCLVTDLNDLGGYDQWVNKAKINFEARVCPRCRLLNKEDSETVIRLLIEAKNSPENMK